MLLVSRRYRAAIEVKEGQLVTEKTWCYTVASKRESKVETDPRVISQKTEIGAYLATTYNV